MVNLTEYRLDTVGIAGDWHGNLDWALDGLNTFARANINVILHLGDFGIGFGQSGAVYLRKLQLRLMKNKQIILVTPGNHEDYAKIDSLKEIPSGDWKGWLQLTSQILLAPRGFHWNWEGREFVSLGGANSIDREWRTANVSWWAGEQISMGDVQRTMDSGPADVFLAHDCPAQVKLSLNHRDFGWTQEGLSYAKKSREMLQHAVDAVRPQLYFHGHYHIFQDRMVTLGDFKTGDTYTTRFVAMDQDGHENNLGVLRLADLNLEILPLIRR